MSDAALRASGDLFVDGQWIRGSGASFSSLNPSSGDPIAEVRSASESQVAEAVSSARSAQGAWAALSTSQRGAFLRAIADHLDAKRESYAALLAEEVGKPVAQGRGEVNFAANLLRYNDGLARQIIGDIVPADTPKSSINLQRVPFGVVALITAWNFPVAMFFRKLAPALLAGNTVVIKGSEYTPLCTLAAAKACEAAGLPAGVVNVLTGDRVVGRSLVTNRSIDMISMTGSAPSGKAILRDSADHLPKVILELGGKGPAIVWDDADLGTTIPKLVSARFQNTGQVCTSAERVYVHQNIWDEFLDRYVAAVSTLTVGDPMGSVDMGPLANLNQLEHVERVVADALSGGARAILQGKSRTDVVATNGYWNSPTILIDTNPDMSVIRDEVFGPVSPVIPFGSLDEALDLANDSHHGLTGFVFSNDYRVVMNVTDRLQVGTVYVNRTQGSAVQGFHSGHKESGLGGEDGVHGLLEYTQIRTIYHNFGD